MLDIHIPGQEKLQIQQVVFDYNGTIALDGSLIQGVEEKIQALQKRLAVYIVTADTYGTVKEKCRSLGVTVKTCSQEGVSQWKKKFVEELEGKTLCIGNGLNDLEMFAAADISIAVMGPEGCCPALVTRADILVPSIIDALDMLVYTNRMKATLRND